MTGLTISNLVLWILQISTIVVVVGLARQVGVLHLRVRPLRAGPTEDGPAIGARLELPPVVSLRGGETSILVPEHLSLVMFASPGCSACAPTMQAVKRLRAVERDVRFVVAVDGGEDGLKYAANYGFTDAVSSDSLGHLGSDTRPFAVVLSGDGTVLGSGVPNTLEQVEALLASARHQNSVKQSSPTMGEQLRSSSEGDGQSAAELSLTDLAPRTQGVDVNVQ